MSDMLIFEDCYEPIRFQMKNVNGEVFDCQTQFRTIENNIEIEKISKSLLSNNKNKNANEESLKMMVLLCGQTEAFWMQFSDRAVTNVIQKVFEAEKEKYKKKLD